MMTNRELQNTLEELFRQLEDLEPVAEYDEYDAEYIAEYAEIDEELAA